MFGICLGHQILGLALGGQTNKMRQGHHGANHPVKDLETGKVVKVTIDTKPSGLSAADKKAVEDAEDEAAAIVD